MLIPSVVIGHNSFQSSLSRRVNANSQLSQLLPLGVDKLIKKVNANSQHSIIVLIFMSKLIKKGEC